MTKGKDLIPGEHNAKGWFKIMWQNQYLWLASLGITGIVWFTVEYGIEGWMWPNFIWPGILIAAVGVITYFGFIKFWNELKGKR